MNENKDRLYSLDKLTIGESGELVNYLDCDKAFRRRLLDMGLTKGVVIKIVKKSPLGNPVSVMLRGYELCLRQEDMEHIKVRKVAK